MKRWYQEQNYWLLIVHMGLHCWQFLPKSFSKVVLFLLSFLIIRCLRLERPIWLFETMYILFETNNLSVFKP